MGFPSLDRAPSPPPLSPFSSFIFFPTCFEDNGLLFWLPDVLCQPTEVVLWSLLSVEMFFWGICEGESGLHVLFLCHLRTAPPFLTLNTSCHSIRPAVSAQRSSDDLMGIPLYIIIFYLVAFNVSWHVPPWVCPAWNSTHPVLGCLFPFSCEESFQLLSLQISGMCVIWILMPLMLSQRSL